MRTTPKYFAILASMAGAALISASCASDGPPTAPVQKNAAAAQAKLQELHAKYDWIGKYHTDGLAYMYKQLMKGNGKPRSRADLCKVAAKAAKEFQKMTRHNDVPAKLLDPALVNETCLADASSANATILVGASGIAAPRKELSAGAVNLLDQISAIASSSTSHYAYVTDIQNVEEQAAYLPFDEAGAVIGVGSIALSSLDYWEANLSSWVSIPGGLQGAYSVSVREMTSANVTSAAAPVIGPAYANWWDNAYVRGFGKVLGADAVSGGRTIVTTWFAGPIGWDAAAASAVFASGATAIVLLF
ncbi:MAG: hypothetical protein ABIQ55_09810 [Gemmatimonadaceae bacterium]